MCGIAGIMHKERAADLQLLQKMTDAIAHRGPDGEGQWLSIDKKTALGHRRLSIIDLSENAKQPMQYSDGRYTLTFNGEIYNYIELRQSLQRKGYTFISNSDTEVLLALYDSKKENCLNDLDGMFAFAIWDEKNKKLFCARDRFGEKPFYFHYEPGLKFTFASEMKALLAEGTRKEVNHKMLFNFLGNISSLSDPTNPSETFFKGIHKLEPAHYLIINHDLTLKKKRYWDIDLHTNHAAISEPEAVDKFKELFLHSLKVRLRSDVPVGSSLSGGIDSSTIVCLIDKLNENNKITQKTFSARFKDFEKDEGKYIELVTSQTKAQSYYTWPDEHTFIEEFDKILYHQEEPFGSASILAQWCVMKLAKENDVTVLLDGQGADEILAGYPYYCKTYLRELYNKRSILYPQELNIYRNNFDPGFAGCSGKKEKMFPGMTEVLAKKIKTTLAPVYHSLIPKKTETRQRNFFHREYLSQFSDKDVYSYSFTGNLNGQLYSSTFVHGLEDLLRYADRSSMAFSREIRLPFLNYKLVEFAFSLPSSFKINSGWTKYILRKSYENVLPSEITWRKDKVGYEPPQQRWLQSGKVKDWVNESKSKLEKEKILDPARDSANDNDWACLMAAKFLSANK